MAQRKASIIFPNSLDCDLSITNIEGSHALDRFPWTTNMCCDTCEIAYNDIMMDQGGEGGIACPNVTKT